MSETTTPDNTKRLGWFGRLWSAAVGPSGSCAGATDGRLHAAVCYVRRIVEAYSNHQCGLLAGACAFSAIFSLIPLLVVGISALGFFVGGSGRALRDMTKVVQGYLPLQSDLIRDTLSHVLADRGLIGFFGLIGLIYTAHQMFLAMMPAMNIIWSVPEDRHWLRQRAIALAATGCTMLLLGADLGGTILFGYVPRNFPKLFESEWVLYVWSVGGALIPFAFSTALFTLLYRLLPSRKVPLGVAVSGGLVGSLMWQVTKTLFTLFIAHSSGYERLYGSISTLAILFVWVYYSMAILLLGAEIAADRLFSQTSLEEAEARAHSPANLTEARGETALHSQPATGQ